MIIDEYLPRRNVLVGTRAFQENTRLAVRVKILESYETVSRIHNNNFDTRYCKLEDNIGQ